jgi:Family of unknown function (DUF5681)
MSEPEAKELAKGDYAVGYCRPPEHGRFKKGKSGNPRGRPKGRHNLKSELMGIALKQVSIRDGDTESQVSLLAANLMTHGVKGAKGDARSSSLFFNQLIKMGLLDPADDADNAAQISGAALIAAANKPGDVLLENIDLNLLSREEQIELSRLAAVIDLGGDILALGTDDFERLKHLVEKGRGKDITPQ